MIAAPRASAIRTPMYEDDADFYDGGRRRAWLTRRVAEAPTPRLLICGLNPSKAGAPTPNDPNNDPTIRVDMGFARRWGFGSFVKVNLFDWIDTHPDGLKTASAPDGDPQNLALIEALAEMAPAIWCCWGDGGALNCRASYIIGALWDHRRKMFHVGLTKAGYPRHPLRLSYETPRAPLYVGA